MSVTYASRRRAAPTPTARQEDAMAIRLWMCRFDSTRSFVTFGMYGWPSAYASHRRCTATSSFTSSFARWRRSTSRSRSISR